MKLKQANKLLKKSLELGIEATVHRFGNRNEYAIEFPWHRTLYRPEHAEEHIEAYLRGEFTDEYRTLAREGWDLVNEARELLGLPYYPHPTIL